MAMDETACCCGASETAGPAILARDGLTGETFRYLTCAACTAQRLSPRPDAASIGAYYPDSYASHTIRRNSLAARVKHLIYLTFFAPDDRLGRYRAPLRLLLRPLRGDSVMSFHPIAPRRIFEFGAATGNDLALFRAEGWETLGCEPSPRACAIAAERGFTLQNTTAEAAELAPASVSAVLINNVLEHVHAPAAVIAKAWAALRPGGSLVVIVPNHAGPSARLFGAAWPGYDAPRHLWGFTPPALAALLAHAGFPPPAIYQRFQGRWAWRTSLDGSRAPTVVAAWRRRFAGPLSLVLLPLGVLAAWLGHGDFMTLVAVKPAPAD